MSNYRVVQAWILTKDGAEKRDGWDLLDGDNWCQRFWYKRDAVAAMRQLQAEERRPSDAQFLAALGPCGK